MVKATKTPAGKVVSSTVYFKKLRHDPEEHPEPVTITLDRDPETGAPRCRTSGVAVDERPLEARMLELLATGPKTKTALSEALGRSRADIEAPLDNLFKARRITTVPTVVRGRSCKAFALRSDTGRTPDDTFGRTTTDDTGRNS